MRVSIERSFRDLPFKPRCGSLQSSDDDFRPAADELKVFEEALLVVKLRERILLSSRNDCVSWKETL